MKSGLLPPTGFFANIKSDFPAAMVVFFVAVPLCLGIALASGAPLFAGIIAGIVGGIVVGAISNSNLGVSGPAAGLTVIVVSSIQQLGTFEIFLLAVVLAGLFQIVLGAVQAGIIGYYFPSSVIKGMLTAIGIIIILKQIPHAIGYDADYEGDMSFVQADGENTFSELLNMIGYIAPGAVVVTVISLAILFVWEAFLARKYPIFKLIQGPLVAILAGIAYQLITIAYFPDWSLDQKHLVNVPVASSLGDFLKNFSFPDFGAILNPEVWIVALTLAVVASLETLLSVEATDKLDPYKRITNTNRELVAQGTGNLVSGLIGGLPVTQVIVRSSANIQSGGKTKLSTILHGFMLLICVAAIPDLLNLIPLAALAAVLFSVGYKLAKPSTFKQMYRLGWSQFLPYMATIAGVVFTDLLKGIAIGLVVAVIIILRNSYKNSHFLHKESGSGNRIKMTLAEEVIFLNKGSIARELRQIAPGTEVTIDMSNSITVDYDVLELIKEFKESAKAKNITVEVITKKGEKPVKPEKAKQPVELRLYNN